MEEGKVIIGIDYYTQLVTENAELKAKVEALRSMVEAEKTTVLYAKDVSAIFGFGRTKTYVNYGKGWEKINES